MKRKIAGNFIIGLWAMLMMILPVTTISQNAPVTTVASITGAVPGTVSVPVSVINFTNIGAISLSLDFDYSVMHYVQSTPNPSLGSMTIGESDLGTGYHRLTIGWFGSGRSLADGSAITTLSFSFIGGSTTLNWYDNGPSCEYADGSYNVLNDIPFESYYLNGHVCGVLTSPGPISGNSNVCPGAEGLYYSISPVTGASGYIWTVPPGAVVAGGGTSTWITLDFPQGASSGNITVAATNLCGNGPSSSLPVTVNELPVANAGNDTTIPCGTSTTLHAANGGTGSYSYHWHPESLLVDPNVQNPSTYPLFSTNNFTLYVTNTVTGCQSSDVMVVSVSGGTLSVNPEADPDTICAGSSTQLYANAGGGSGIYTYQWTSDPPGNPAWNSDLPSPVVTPDTTTRFTVTVNDGYTIAYGDVIVTVLSVPSTPVVVFENHLLSSDIFSGNQWYFNGLPIAGATGQLYEVEEEGLYYDIAFNGSCYSDTSNQILVSFAGLKDEGNKPVLLLYPNPADEVLFITVKGLDNYPYSVTVVNLAGQKVAEIPADGFHASEPLKIDISSLTPGAYAAILWAGGNRVLKKIFLVR